jgi:hypothetical protein
MDEKRRGGMQPPPVKFCLAIYMHKFAVFVADAEGDFAIGEGKQGVVCAHADIAPWVNPGAALANDDVARNGGFATELFDAQAAAFTIPAVGAASTCFFVCHVRILSF